MNILIIAPHQDDEILSSCLLIQSRLRAGDEIFIAFATNGDRHGLDMGMRRYRESVCALQLLHIKADHVFYLGYGDTGMRFDHSFLYRLFYSEKHTLISSAVSSKTYHPAGEQTLHHICTGQETAYCHSSFLNDLNCLLDVCRAELVILPSGLDWHGDHRACFLFMDELRHMRKSFPPMLTYLIHAGDDMLWPNRNAKEFSRPSNVVPELWAHRVNICSNKSDQQMKQTCIQCFQSQEPLAQNHFLMSFAKREEIFFPFLQISQP